MALFTRKLHILLGWVDILQGMFNDCGLEEFDREYGDGVYTFARELPEGALAFILNFEMSSVTCQLMDCAAGAMSNRVLEAMLSIDETEDGQEIVARQIYSDASVGSFLMPLAAKLGLTSDEPKYFVRGEEQQFMDALGEISMFVRDVLARKQK